MRIALLTLIYFVLLTSCSKEDSDVTERKKKVRFNIQNFEQTYTTQSNNKTSTTYSYDYNLYKILNDNSLESTEHIENFTDTEISFLLYSGKYKLVVVASNENIGEFRGGSNVYDLLEDTFIESSTLKNDVFIGELVFEINEEDNDLSNEINLTRYNGKVNIAFTNDIDTDVTKLEFIFYKYFTSLWIYHDKINPYYSTKKIFEFNKNESNTYEMPILPCSELELEINFKDANDQIITSKTITNISILENTITKLSGQYENSNNNNSNFDITIDDSWNSDIITVEF